MAKTKVDKVVRAGLVEQRARVAEVKAGEKLVGVKLKAVEVDHLEALAVAEEQAARQRTRISQLRLAQAARVEESSIAIVAMGKSRPSPKGWGGGPGDLLPRDLAPMEPGQGPPLPRGLGLPGWPWAEGD